MDVAKYNKIQTNKQKENKTKIYYISINNSEIRSNHSSQCQTDRLMSSSIF